MTLWTPEVLWARSLPLFLSKKISTQRLHSFLEPRYPLYRLLSNQFHWNFSRSICLLTIMLLYRDILELFRQLSVYNTMISIPIHFKHNETRHNEIHAYTYMHAYAYIRIHSLTHSLTHPAYLALPLVLTQLSPANSSVSFTALDTSTQ